MASWSGVFAIGACVATAFGCDARLVDGEAPSGERVHALLLEREDGSTCHAVCLGEGQAVTAAHCIDGGALHVVSEDGTRAPARARGARPRGGGGLRNDLARLEVGSICGRAPRASAAELGTAVRLVRRVERDAPSDGFVRDRGSGLVITTPLVCAGDSGAPLVDAAGRLVGVAVARTFDGCAAGGSVFVEVPAPI
jgi:hypothetical protein